MDLTVEEVIEYHKQYNAYLWERNELIRKPFGPDKEFSNIFLIDSICREIVEILLPDKEDANILSHILVQEGLTLGDYKNAFIAFDREQELRHKIGAFTIKGSEVRKKMYYYKEDPKLTPEENKELKKLDETKRTHHRLYQESFINNAIIHGRTKNGKVTGVVLTKESLEKAISWIPVEKHHKNMIEVFAWDKAPKQEFLKKIEEYELVCINVSTPAIEYSAPTPVAIHALQPNNVTKKAKVTTNKVYTVLSRYLSRYEIPVVTEDFRTLIHWDSVLAAKANGQKEINVIKAKGLSEDDVIMFIIYGMSIKSLTYAERFALLVELEDYLLNNLKGKLLKKQIGGDINQAMGTLLGFDKETIKLIKRFGQFGIKYLDHGTLREIKEAILIDHPKAFSSGGNTIIADDNEFEGISFEFRNSSAKLAILGNEVKLSDTQPKIINKKKVYNIESADKRIKINISISLSKKEKSAPQG